MWQRSADEAEATKTWAASASEARQVKLIQVLLKHHCAHHCLIWALGMRSLTLTNAQALVN